ncbi:efflux transporter, RND family, MFP subunit [Thermovirga lienii DSM 17291]|uniref:Efflux transporter, RND family, MFP subunit n=1 Tax=Thermovirga lienii (strain ATCC BAA-1197 / DSM 17291 / Cas60314) TaxID=580340 RepID=G7V6Q6_THELD|nr:efflux RND transporter periplasmic adaptor subunit [Thermovirga lienii]AER66015.1 efflux transporter, RND family, MFP subunit [Thermovirga lienii DSM 17291]
MNKKLLLGLAGVFLLAALVWLYLSRGTEVETAFVQIGDVVRTVEEDGYVEAVGDRALYAVHGGKVSRVFVKTNDVVHKDQELIRMENKDIEASLSEIKRLLAESQRELDFYRASEEKARIALADAERTMKRYKRLYDSQEISLSEYEQATLNVEEKRRELEKARSNLLGVEARTKGLKEQLEALESKRRELIIKSPIDGYVLKLPAEEEQVVSPGELLVIVAPRGPMEIRADFLSDLLSEIKVGQKVMITAQALGDVSLKGQIDRIYPLAEEKISPLGVEQRRVPVYVSLPHVANLMPGYEVRIAVETARREQVKTLPIESVRTNSQGSSEVLKIVDGRVRIVPVDVGLKSRQKVEIVEGLDEGDVVVKDAGIELDDGAKVKAAGAFPRP